MASFAQRGSPRTTPTGKVWMATDLKAGGDALLQRKAAYLNVPFFTARAVLYFLFWAFMARTLIGMSPRPVRKMTGIVHFARTLRTAGLRVGPGQILRAIEGA